MSVVQRALQPALQPPMHPPLQSQLHSQLEMQSYSHLCLAKLCNLLETELRCLPSSQLGSQLRTRPRAHDRCLLTYPAIFSLNSVLQRQPFREELRFSSRIANRPQLDEICSTTFSTAYAHLFTCHAFTNTFNYLHVIRKQEECKDWTATVMRFDLTTASSSVFMPARGWTCRCSPPGRRP